VSVTTDLLKEFESKVTSWELIPSGGGRFEVKVDGKLVYSKLQTGRHTDSNELRGLLKKKL
jgi:selenoprotein W-related protein